MKCLRTGSIVCLLVAAVSIVFVGSGCSSLRSSSSEVWDVFKLSGSDLTDLRKRTMLGDADAAYTLYLYYAKSRDDSETAHLWVKQAAYLGHESAREFFELQRFQLTEEEHQRLYPSYGNSTAEPFDPFRQDAFPIESQ